jgi:predicted N-acetyltransferase YhbS
MQPLMRQATEADLPAVERLVNAAYVVEEFFLEGGRIDLDQLVDTARNGGRFIVLEERGTDEMIGCVCVTCRPRTGFISLLSVVPTRQGQGFSPLLVRAAEAQMIGAGCELAQLEVVNLRAELIPYYEHLGFVIVGTAPFPKPWKLKRDAHLIVMQKEL